ncbi:MAG: FtsQ-type POTRA domain-containing protein [Litoreibacter sp.]|nr:FtsQ-type POTRA domain-containing protein [Litoreibacter sp.]
MRSLRPRKRSMPQHDPAPSRVAYRLNRLWLTPHFRRFLRFGLPVLCVLTAFAVFVSDQERVDGLVDRMVELRRSVEERPEFMVNLMAIDGASADLAVDIREVVPVDLPRSSFDLDLEAMRQQVESLDAVRSAKLSVKSGGVLQVDVTERVPAVVWRSPDGLELLDAEGHRVAALDSRKSRPDLMLIAGEGADHAVAEALALAHAAAPVHDRMIGLIRVAEHRWDIVLDRGQRIMLPERSPRVALDRVMALNGVQDLLARDLVRVDFRNPKRPILRLGADALAALEAESTNEDKRNSN